MSSEITIWRSSTGDVMSLLIDGLGGQAFEEHKYPMLLLPDRGLVTVRPHHREPGIVQVSIHPGDADRDVVTDRVFHLVVKRTWWPIETWSGSGVRRARLRTPGAESPRQGRRRKAGGGPTPHPRE